MMMMIVIIIIMIIIITIIIIIMYIYRMMDIHLYRYTYFSMMRPGRRKTSCWGPLLCKFSGANSFNFGRCSTTTSIRHPWQQPFGRNYKKLWWRGKNPPWNLPNAFKKRSAPRREPNNIKTYGSDTTLLGGWDPGGSCGFHDHGDRCCGTPLRDWVVGPLPFISGIYGL